MNTTVFVNKFQSLPEAAQAIILDFIDFISVKYKKQVKREKRKISSENTWKLLENSLDKFTSDFMNERKQPQTQMRNFL